MAVVLLHTRQIAMRVGAVGPGHHHFQGFTSPLIEQLHRLNHILHFFVRAEFAKGHHLFGAVRQFKGRLLHFVVKAAVGSQ
jgi:hypothetical protein